MLLYTMERAPNGRRVEIFLAEKQITIPVEQVDLGKMEHRTPDFTSKNVLQRIPVLELDDGSFISESVAICRYLELLHPEPALFGKSPKQQALVETWSRRLELDFWLPVQAAFRHLHPGMAAREVPQVPAWGEACKPKAMAFLALLDEHLAANIFVCGEDYSVADITGLITLDFFKLARLAVPEEMTHVKRWHAAISSRPSASA